MKKKILIITSIAIILTLTLLVGLVNVVAADPANNEIAIEQRQTQNTLHDVSQYDDTDDEHTQGEPAGYAPNEVIVVFDNNKAFQKAESTAESAVKESENVEIAGDINVETISRADRAALIQTDENIDEKELCEELESKEGVAFAQPNFYYEFDEAAIKQAEVELNATTDQWNLDAIQAKEAWDHIDALRNKSYWKADKHPRVKVAVLDTGATLDYNHLKDISQGGNMDVANCIMIGSEDKGYHGTRVTSIIASTNNNTGLIGAAAGNNNDIVQVMSIDVYSQASPNIHMARTTDVIDGIDTAMSKGARVIQMCLGHSWNQNDYQGNAQNDYVLEQKINEAVDSGIIVTASAGNNNNTEGWYPSDFDSVISVISTDSENQKSKTSNFGPKKDISAPGNDVLVMSETGRILLNSGTSFAAPVVASVAAMVLYIDQTLTVDKVKNILYSTTTDIYTSGWDELSGWGIVNADKAVKMTSNLAESQKYDKEEEAPQYLKSAANCTLPAIYYKSSESGKSSKGTDWEETFSVGEPLGHSWNEGEVTKLPTATEDGVRTYTCTKCQATRNESIEKTGGENPGGSGSETSGGFNPPAEDESKVNSGESGGTVTADIGEDVKVKKKSNSSGYLAVINVNGEIIEQIAKAAKENNSRVILIDAVSDTKEDIVGSEVIFSKYIVDSADENGAVIKIRTNTGSVTFDRDTIKKLSEEDTDSMKFVIEKSAISTENQVVYEITCETKDGDTITPVTILGGMIEVAVDIPEILGEKRPVVLCINGRHVEQICSGIEDDKLIMTIEHLSTYAVMSEEDANKAIKNSAEATTMGALKLKSCKNGKIKSAWKNGEGNIDSIIKYQVYRATDKKFKKGLKKYTTTKNVYIITGNLKKNTRYYVKVRAYIKINNKTYYSKWSSVKSVRTK